MINYNIPNNPGLIEMPVDERDYKYGAIFGKEKYPRKFSRKLPEGMVVPYQGQVPACVSCAFTFVNQYKSRVNDGNDVNLSFRKIHADTGEFGVGRNLRSISKYLQSNGQPQDLYLPDDISLPKEKFMESSLSPDGLADAQMRKTGPYTLVSTILDELCPAVVKEPFVISLGGNNEDWRKPYSEIIKQTKSPKWYHAIVLWDYNIDEGWLGIYNWWNDIYRRISIDYSLTGALTFVDLPDERETKMLRVVKTDKKDDCYVITKNEEKRRIPDSDTYHYFRGQLGIIGDIDIITDDEMYSYKTGEMLPSVKLTRTLGGLVRDIYLEE